MGLPLKQSTASQEIPLGYFVDSTDGNTEETGLTIANTDIKIWKAGATTLANKNSGGATHISNGVYYAVLDATDTDTLGPLVVFCHVSGALWVRQDCVVLPPKVYDSMIAGSDNLEVDAIQVLGAAVSTTTAQIGVNVVQISADATAADNAEAFFDGTGYAGTGNTIPTVTTVTNLTNAPTNGDLTATMKTSVTTAATAATPTVTAGTVSDKSGYSLSGTQTFNVTGNITGNLSGSVGSVTGAVGSVTGNVGGNVVGSVGSVTGAVGSVTGNVGGNVAGSVASVIAGVTVTTNNDKTGYTLTSGPLDAAGVRTAIGLATANLDTQLAAIVGDTNELQTDWANGGRLDLLIDGLIADLVKVKAAVYDTASVTGSVITLSNGATQTIGADGDRTTA